MVLSSSHVVVHAELHRAFKSGFGSAGFQEIHSALPVEEICCALLSEFRFDKTLTNP